MPNSPARSVVFLAMRWLLALSAPLFLGCNTLAVTMLGVGANIGINHQISGYASKTFVRPLPDILDAAQAALDLMEIAVFTIDAHGGNRTLWAYAGDLSIEIELDALTPTTTRMRVIARRSIGILVDASTAQAITLETETQLRRAQAASEKAPTPP